MFCLVLIIKSDPDSISQFFRRAKLWLSVKLVRIFVSLRFDFASAYGAQASPEILAAICASAAKISLDVQIRRDWLKRAEKVNLPASDMLPLKEAILRQENPNSQVGRRHNAHY